MARKAVKAPEKKTTKAPKPEKVKKERVIVPTASDYLAALRGIKGVEEGDYAFFGDDLAWTSSVEEFISTGSLALNRLTGGGWPVGRLTELAAWEGVGKTTLLDQSIALHQASGGIAVLIDSEQARDESYSVKLGVNPKELIIRKALTLEQGFEGLDQVLAIQEAHMEKLAAKGLKVPPMLIVWDSLGGTPAAAEYEGEAGDKHVGVASRIIKMNFRRMTQRLAHCRAAFVFGNHFYQTMGPFASLVTYGGSGIRYYTSLRLWLSRTGSLKVGDRVVGHKIEAKLRKTRISRPRPPAEVGLVYGSGLHNAYSLFEWGKTHGEKPGHKWVKHSGQWSYLMFEDGTYEAFQQSFVGFGELLQKRPDLYEMIAQKYHAEDEVVVELPPEAEED